MNADDQTWTTDCPSPYVNPCVLSAETTTTTAAAPLPRELPDTGSNATATIGFAGVVLVGTGIIAVIAGRRRRTT